MVGGGTAKRGGFARCNGWEFAERREDSTELSCWDHGREAHILGELPISCPERSVAGRGANQLHHAAEALMR